MDNEDILMLAGWNIIDGFWCNPKLNNEAIFDCKSVNNHDKKRFVDMLTSTAYSAGAYDTANKAKKEIITITEQISIHNMMSYLS